MSAGWNVSSSCGDSGRLTSYVRKPKRPVVTRISRFATVSNLPSTIRAEFGTRATYSSESEIAAPGGGVATTVAAPAFSPTTRAAETTRPNLSAM